MNVLGIETSCDETAASVVRDGRDVLSSIVFSQVHLHSQYGGVVPEIASRNHVESLPGVIDRAVCESKVGWDGIDAVAVTFGPGLASSLLVGLSAGKALAFRLGKPFYAINHLEAHIYSIFLGKDAPPPVDVCPLVTLLVSGGHTCLLRVEGLGEYRLLGQTTDDAAGEAFDKGANLLGLGYPGGPAIEKAAQGGDPELVRFARGVQKKVTPGIEDLDPSLCFTFSGVKTALLYYLKDHPIAPENGVASLAASYQEAIVDSIIKKVEKAIRNEKILSVVGGVSLNTRLRDKLGELTRRMGIRLILADRRYCTDNAAMVAGLAGAGRGISGRQANQIDACPNADLRQKEERTAGGMS